MRFGRRRKIKNMRNRDRKIRTAHKHAALKINSNARLDAPQFIENNQKYERVAHRALEKLQISNANAATKRDATQRKQISYAPSVEKTQKAQATLPTQRRDAQLKKNNSVRLDAPQA